MTIIAALFKKSIGINRALDPNVVLNRQIGFKSEINRGLVLYIILLNIIFETEYMLLNITKVFYGKNITIKF